jgi:lambda family phage portal protein
MKNKKRTGGLWARFFGKKPAAQRAASGNFDLLKEADSVLSSFERYVLETYGDDKTKNKVLAGSPKLQQAVKARYEAAWWSPNRSFLYSFVQDAEQDMNFGTQREIMRRTRWFEKNNPTLQKILDLIETNVVGTGINPTPASESGEWNAAALKFWNRWVEWADLGQRLHFYQVQAIISRAVAVDGEIFLHLTEDPESKRPRVELIEAHRVTSANISNDERFAYLHDADGVYIDKATGKAVAYAVTTAGSSEIRIILAKDIVHIYEPSRVNQYRGVSLFHAICNTLHDLDDLQTFEMLAAKDASEKSVIIKTATGEAPDSIIGDGQLSPMQPVSPETKSAYYVRAFGGKNLVLQTGDDATQFESNRPSPAMRDFWQYLERKVCQGIGISAAAVLDYEGGWGGAALRGAICCDNRFYECRTSALIPALNRVWAFALGWAQKHPEIEKLPVLPADWKKVRWQPPRRASVDIGRDSSALINELRAGVRTYRDVLGEQGGDWKEVLRQRATEQKYIQDLATELDVPVENIAALDSGERSQAAAREERVGT